MDYRWELFSKVELLRSIHALQASKRPGATSVSNPRSVMGGFRAAGAFPVLVLAYCCAYPRPPYVCDASS